MLGSRQRINCSGTMEQQFFCETAERYSTLFRHIAEIGIVKEMSFEIDIKDFENKYRDKKDVRHAAPFKQMFDALTEVDNLPCLYRWEITSPYNEDDIKQAVGELQKFTPRVLKKAKATYNTLYVGKVKKSIVGRIIQHLGYHRNPASHGLQLNDWAKPMNLHFRLHIIVLSDEVIPVEEIFETELAHKYVPLIGIH